VLIGGLGIQRTFYLAATEPAGRGRCVGVSRRVNVSVPVAETPVTVTDPVTHDAVPATTVLVVMAVSGLPRWRSDVWFRVLVQFLPATTYAFTTMLATVLAGIAGGSALAARQLATPRAWGATLAWVQGATSLVVLLSLAFLGATYAAGWRTSGLTQAAAAAILPASLLMGYAFPVAIALWTRAGRAAGETGRPVGVLYSANVLGGIAAPSWAVSCCRGSAAARRSSRSRRSTCSRAWRCSSRAAAGCRHSPWLRSSGAARLVPDPFEVTLARRHGQNERIFWREEGVQTSVSIHTGAFRGWLMYLDGLHQASDGPDMVRLHRLIGHLPMVLHRIRNVLSSWVSVVAPRLAR
jgi:hypothetical protein